MKVDGMDEKALIFLHIPKTGGRSLQDILLRQFADGNSVTNAHERLAEIRVWPEQRKRDVRYIQGHFVYGVHEILPQESTYIAMLRDPIDRVISHYYYIKGYRKHPLNRIIEEKDLDLEGYVTSGICSEVRNDQTRMIAGIAQNAEIEMGEMLRIAKENIDRKFMLVGLVERFDEVLVLLKRYLGLRSIYYGIRNQNYGRPLKEQIPERTLEIIREYNRADVELYAYARDKLNDKINGQGPSFIMEVNRFKFLNKPYSELFHLIRKMKNMILR
jgi:hypothetical protein